MKKKLFAVVLALVMCLSLVPTMAFAYPVPLNYTWKGICDEIAAPGTSYVRITLPNSLSASTLEATADDSCLVIPEGKTVILDLNGWTLDRGLSATNPASQDGRVITVEAGAKLTVKNGTITGGSTSGNGGAIYAYNNTELTITDCTIEGNQAYISGGAILHGGLCSISNTTIQNNYAATGGGGAVFSCGELTMDKCNILNNQAAKGAGGVYIYGTNDSKTRGNIVLHSTISNSVIRGNKAGSSGGGIFVDYYDMDLTMSNTAVSYNSAKDLGGGLFTNRSITLGQGNSFSNNTAGVFVAANLFAPNMIKGGFSAKTDVVASFVLRIVSGIFSL